MLRMDSFLAGDLIARLQGSLADRLCPAPFATKQIPGVDVNAVPGSAKSVRPSLEFVFTLHRNTQSGR
ncbi:MAG: hypothetical protein JWN34_797 [Bryobacterales bacterium]|nr:hypothetical protein [Bryobacterales bacterium]